MIITTTIATTTHPDKLFEITADDPHGGTVHRFNVTGEMVGGVLTVGHAPPCELAEVTAMTLGGDPVTAWERLGPPTYGFRLTT